MWKRIETNPSKGLLIASSGERHSRGSNEVLSLRIEGAFCPPPGGWALRGTCDDLSNLERSLI